MKEKICIADGIEAGSLIGKIVYFKAQRLVKLDGSCARWRGDNRRFYDLIPGTVIHATPAGVGMEAAGGFYNRSMANIVLAEDLDHWMHNNPESHVLRGDQ